MNIRTTLQIDRVGDKAAVTQLSTELVNLGKVEEAIKQKSAQMGQAWGQSSATLGAAKVSTSQLSVALAAANSSTASLGAATVGLGNNLASNAQQIQRNQQAVGYWTEAYNTLRDTLTAIPRFFSATTDSAVAAADAITNLSQQNGAAVTTLQQFAFVGRDVGASVGEIGLGMRSLQRAIGSGSAATAEAVSNLGLSLDDLRRARPEEQFETILKGLTRIPEEARRTDLALQLLGRGGAALLPLATDIDRLKQRANDLGVVMSAETVKGLDDFGDAVGRLKRVTQGLGQNLAAGFLGSPPVVAIVEATTDKVGALSKRVQELNSPTRELVGLTAVLTGKLGEMAPRLIELGGALGGIASGLKDLGKLGTVTVGVSAALASARTWIAGGLLGGASISALMLALKSEFASGGVRAATTFVASIAATLSSASAAGAIGAALLTGIISYLTLKAGDAFSKWLTGQDLADSIRNYFDNFGIKADQSGLQNTLKLLADKGFSQGNLVPRGAGPLRQRTQAELEQSKALRGALIEEAQARAQLSGTIADQVAVLKLSAAAKIADLEETRRKLASEKEAAAAVAGQIEVIRRVLALQIEQITTAATFNRLAAEHTRMVRSIEEAEQAHLATMMAAEDEQALRLIYWKEEARAINEAAERLKQFNAEMAQLFLDQARGARGRGNVIPIGTGGLWASPRVAQEIAEQAGEATNVTTRWSQALQDVANAFRLLGMSADNALSKVLVGMLAGLSAGEQLRELAKQQGGTVTVGQFGVAALQTAAAAYQSGSVLGGAGAGAAFGSTFGPIGTAIGAAAGGLLGLFGKAAAARRELENLRKSLVDTYGSMETASRLAKALGYDLDRAFATKNPQLAKEAVEQFQKALQKAKDELSAWEAGIVSASARALILAAPDDATVKAFVEKQRSAAVAGLASAFSGIGAPGARQRAELQAYYDQLTKDMDEIRRRAAERGGGLTPEEEARLGTLSYNRFVTGGKLDQKGTGGIRLMTPEDARAQATIASVVFWDTFKTEGLLKAAEAFGPIIENLQASLAAIGGDAAAAAILAPIQTLIDLGTTNEAFRGATEGAQGLATTLDSLANRSIPLTIGQFGAFQQQATSAYQQALQAAIESGMGQEQAQSAAIMAVAPLLQSLVQASQQYGIQLDDNTMQLLGMAEASGIAFQTDGTDRLIAAINALTVTLGGVPPAFETMAGAATTTQTAATTAAAQMSNSYNVATTQVIERWNRAQELMVDGWVTTLPNAIDVYIGKLDQIPTSIYTTAYFSGEGGGGGTGLAGGALNRYFGARAGGHWLNVAEGGRGEYVTVTHGPVAFATTAGQMIGSRRVPAGVTHALGGFGDKLDLNVTPIPNLPTIPIDVPPGADTIATIYQASQSAASAAAIADFADELSSLTATVAALAKSVKESSKPIQIVSSPTIAPQIDPKGIKRNHDDFLAEVEEALAQAIRLGNSALLRALEQKLGSRITGRR